MAERNMDGDGGRAEEAVRLFLLSTGYFVVRGVKLTVENDTVTDVDLWAYGPGSPTHRERVLADCKYKRAHAQGFERLVWLEGLRKILGAEHSILATTDGRQTLRAMAARHGVRYLGPEQFDRLIAGVATSARFTEEELVGIVIPVDDKLLGRLRERMDRAKTSLLRLDWDSVNEHIEQLKAHVDDLARRRDRSASVRLIYLTAAYVLITLDYALRDAAFLDSAQVRSRIEDGLKYGTRGRVGVSVLLQSISISKGKRAETMRVADELRADIPSGFFQKHVGTDWIFKTAISLEAAAYNKQFVPTPKLGAEAQSALGVLLDFISVDRRVVFDVAA